VGSRLVFRLQKQLSESTIAELNKRFGDLFSTAPLEITDPLPQEINEPETLSLARLVCSPHKRHFGRMRQLIDAFNAEASDGASKLARRL
jgi:hypothetical protein